MASRRPRVDIKVVREEIERLRRVAAALSCEEWDEE